MVSHVMTTYLYSFILTYVNNKSCSIFYFIHHITLLPPNIVNESYILSRVGMYGIKQNSK